MFIEPFVSGLIRIWRKKYLQKNILGLIWLITSFIVLMEMLIAFFCVLIVR